MKLNERSFSPARATARPPAKTRNQPTPPPATGLRERRRAATTAAFVDAAELVIAAKGFDRATMQDVARAAGCAPGTIYLYFAHKDELFTGMVSKHVAALTPLMRAALADAANPLAALRSHLAVLLGYFNAHRTFFQIFYTAGPGGRAHVACNMKGEALKLHLETKAAAVSVVKAAQRKRLVRRDVAAAELVEFISAVNTVTLARWALAAEAPSPAEQLDLLWKLHTGGLGAVGATP